MKLVKMETLLLHQTISLLKTPPYYLLHMFGSIFG